MSLKTALVKGVRFIKMIFLDLFLSFFKIGAFTFGGGYAMLPLIKAEAESKGWMSVSELVNFIAVSESTPGPFAVNTSTYIGAETGGFFGALCATLGVVLPSFIIIIIIAKFFMSFCENRFVKGCMNGLRPAVVAMIASAALSVGQSIFFPEGISAAAFKETAFIASAVIFAAAMVFTFKKLHPIFIIVICALLGIAAGYMGLF